MENDKPNTYPCCPDNLPSDDDGDWLPVPDYQKQGREVFDDYCRFHEGRNLTTQQKERRAAKKKVLEMKQEDELLLMQEWTKLYRASEASREVEYQRKKEAKAAAKVAAEKVVQNLLVRREQQQLLPVKNLQVKSNQHPPVKNNKDSKPVKFSADAFLLQARARRMRELDELVAQLDKLDELE
jgi:hypothetical protein